jgi:hypothetical protein
MSGNGGEYMLKVLASMITVGLLAIGCTGGNDGASEPVGPDETPPAIPDAPGESGESAEKPAGAGEAGTDELPETEKSKPNIDAAKGAAGSGTVDTGALNVRSGPGMKHDVVKVLMRGEKVSVSECGDVWCKIGEGQYVSKKFLAN